MLTELVQGIIDGLGNVTDAAEVLPLSPFYQIQAVAVDNEILAFISWLVPFEAIIPLMYSWLAAISVWYLAKKALRWARLIQ